MHISNLYASKTILLFKRCYAMEKIDGTSCHVTYSTKTNDLTYFSGCIKQDLFRSLFDHAKLLDLFRQNAQEHPKAETLTIYGEGYGGKVQGRSKTYGPNTKFVAFEVKINDTFLCVPEAEKIALKFGLEFVDYVEIDTTEEAIHEQTYRDSVQAVRNGMGPGHMREGVVLRPLIELVHDNGGRIICKNKRPEFNERQNPPNPFSAEEQAVLDNAKAIALEWVTAERLKHVLQTFPTPTIQDTGKVIGAMVEDVERESVGEIVISKESKKAIGAAAGRLFKEWLRSA
jgi:hypothetical protein